MKAIIIFVDIRGFTHWSESTETTDFAPSFVEAFMKTIKEKITHSIVKGLGDGAMIVKEIHTDPNEESIMNDFSKLLLGIAEVENDFKSLCLKMSRIHGHKTDLRLGWGVVRGSVKKFGHEGYWDYLGSNINKCARLCGIARPFGVVIDREDFWDIPKDSSFKFLGQTHRLPGLKSDVKVWVTNEISSQFIPREKLRETPEVHVAGVCFKKDNNVLKALIAKRKSNREIFPNLYEGCGGQLAFSESFTDGIRRHFMLEMKISVKVIQKHNILYEIAKPNIHIIPGIKFIALHESGEPESENHEHITWVTKSGIQDMSEDTFIPGTKNDFLAFFSIVESPNFSFSQKWVQDHATTHTSKRPTDIEPPP